MATLQPGEKARMYALGKIARGGATRGGYVSGGVFIAIDGFHVGYGAVDPHYGVMLETLTITDELDDTPNTATMTIQGYIPATGAEIIITLGSKNSLTRLFAGFALTVTQRYFGIPRNVGADVAAVDYTWFLNFTKATKAYRSQSATAIAKDLIATYAAADGFTSAGVAPGLPALDEITYTNEDLAQALTRLARRIGAYWYVDYHKDVHLFIDEPQRPNPEPLIATHRSLHELRRTADRTQVLTRVFVEGRGSSVLTEVAAGDTRIPVAAVDMFAPAPDVFLQVSPLGSEGGASHLTFSGVIAGGGGAVIGPGIGPTTAPTLTAVSGAGIETGAHSYAVTYKTAAGESLASPAAAITLGPLANPTIAPAWMFQNDYPIAFPSDSAFRPGDSLRWAYTWSLRPKTDNYWGVDAMTALSPPSAAIIAQASVYYTYTPGDSAKAQGYQGSVPTDARFQTVHLYRSVNGGPFRGVSSQAIPPGAYAWVVNNETENHNGQAPPSGTPSLAIGRVQLGNLQPGPASVTAQRIYRTAAGASQLKFLVELPKTTATYLDTAADATLGANIPTGDTSGLAQPAGQVLPGAASIPVASVAGFETAGGWASIGNGEQVIRYTGITAAALTGIPASGAGAITATVVFNSTVTATPMLTGVGGVTVLGPGDELYLVVFREDASRKTALATMVKAGPGLRDEWIQDRRLSIPEARARALATLALHPLDETSITYQCRDLRTAAGKSIAVNLPSPTSLIGTFKIQHVTIDNFRPRPNQYPTFTVTASSQRFSFEDWLRRMKTSV